MITVFTRFLTKYTTASLFQERVVILSIFAFMSGIARTFKAVNRRVLSTIGTTLMLSALLSACGGGGGGGGGSDAPAPTPAAPTTPTFTVSSSNFSVDEDFTGSRTVASISNATAITVSQSNTGVVTVTNSNSQVNVSSIANANGRTTLTIRATNGTLIATTQVTVIVNAVNDLPTLAVSSNSISTVGGFSPITINTTASDIEDANLTFTVVESTTGVVRVGTSADAIILSNMPNASGQTTLTITAVDSSGSTVTQIIAVNVIITTSTSIPALSVSTIRINEQEDFGTAVVIRTTATDADGDTITLSVSPLRGIVNAVISPLIISTDTTSTNTTNTNTTGTNTTSTITTSTITTNTITNIITLTAVGNANGTATLTVLAADVGGQSTEVKIVVVVAAVNDTPTFTIPTPTLTILEDFDGIRSVATFADVDNNTLTINVAESATGVVTVTTSASSVQIASLADINGQTTLSITISDGILSSTAQVVVIVAAVNDLPVLTVSTTALTLDEDFAQISIDTTRSDVDGDTLTLTVAESTTGVVTITTTASGVQVASIANANGQTTLTITLSDGTASTSTQVAVVVNAINDAPVLIVSTTALTLIEDFSTAVLIATTRSDVEGDTLTFTVSESVTGVVTVTTSASGVQVANIANANGQTTLTFTLSDGTTNTSVQVRVSVAAVNDTPILSVSTNNLSTLGGFTPITIITTASDVEDANLTVTVTESTTGVVRVAQSANAIILHTIAGASGTTTLTVSVVDSSGTTVIQTIVVNVTVTAGAAPVLMVSTNSINVQEDFSSVVIRTTASDSDSTTLTLTVTPSMRLVNVAISTRTNDLSTITLTAIANLNGTATLTFRATDDGGQTNSTEIVVVVAAVNDTPTITVPTPNLAVLEDFDGATSVATFADVDSGDALTVTVTESNAGVVTVTTSASGVSVSAIANRNGRTTLNISVSDGTLSSTAQVVVDVTPVNDPPVLSVSTNALALAEDFATAVVIGTTRSDIDNDTLTLTVVESTTGVVTVTTSSSGVSVAAINNANGATTLTIILSDGTTSTSTQVSVAVTAVNDPPTLSVSTNALTLNEDFATTEVITVTSNDVDGDTLTLTVAESTTGVVTVTTTASGVQVASIFNANGQTILTITLSDGSVDTTAQVAVIVNAVNDAPSLNISTTNVVVDEDFTTAVTIATATDVENNTLTISVAESTTGVVTVTTSASSVQVASILNANGQTTLTITVNDGTVDTTAQVVVTVTAVNDTPTVIVSNNNITAAVDFSTITINVTLDDAEDSTLSFSVENSNAGVVTVSTSTNAIFLNAVAGSTGQTSIVVRTTDSAGLSAMQTIAVNVTDATTPTLMVSTNLINVQEDFGSSVVIRTTATDSDGRSIALSVSSSSFVAAVISSPVSGISTITNTITLTAIKNASGRSTLTVQAESVSGLKNSTEIVVVIAPVNDTPTLTIPNANLVVAEDFSGNSTIATAIDIDGDTPIFSVSESMTGLVTVSTSAAGVFVSSILNANGQTTLTITVRDGSLTSTAQVVVTVTEINDPPVLNIPNATVTRVEDFVGGVTVATANDVDGNPLTFSVIESTTGVIRVTASTLDVLISSLGEANGITTLSISVSDGRLVSSTAQVVVTVTPANDPPVLTVSTNALTVAEDFATVLIATTRTDIDSNNLTLTVAESTTGVVTVSTTDAGVSVSSIRHANGQTTLTITLSDNDLTSTAQVVVDVTPINDPPVLTVSTNALTLNEDFGTVLIATTRSDVEGDALTITVAESATGVVTVQTSTSGISVSSIGNINGRTTLTITLSDSQLISTAQVVVDVTPVNDAPTFAIPSAALTVAEDFASTLTIATANDVDGGTLTITVVESSTGLVSVITSASGVQIVSLGDVNGQTTLTLTVSDSTLSSTTQVVVTVTPVNDPPVLTVSTNTLTLIEDFTTAVLIATTGTDIDSNALTLTVAGSPAGVVTVTTTDAGVSVSSIRNANGRTILTITLSDGDQSTTTQVVVDVTGVNDPPTINVATTTVTVVEDFSNTIALAIGNDVDNFGVNFIWVESTTGIVAVNVSPFELQMATIRNANGVTTISYSVRDGEFRSSTFQVVVTVLPVNDPPVLSVSTAALTLAEEFAGSITIANATDVDGDALNITVVESTTGVVNVTTLASGVQVASILNANGRTTLTVRVTDGDGLFDTTDVSVVVNNVDDPPVLTVSTNLILVDEDFSSPVVIRTTATNADGDALIVSITSSSSLVDAVLSTPVNGTSIITNMITLSAMTDLNGTTTLTVQAIDAGGTATTEQIVVVVNAVDDPILFTLSTTAITLSAVGNQINRNIQNIIISNPGNETLRAQLQVTSSGDPIFSANPTPVVSFTTNALTTTATLTSATSTAQLYFTIAPNQTGTATLTVHLTNLDGSIPSQQTMVVSVNSPNVPPAIVLTSSSLTNLVVHGSRLYANDTMASGIGISRFLGTASAWGGHLMNINSVEEFTFMRSAASGLIIGEAWLGMVLPQQRFPGELSWITHDSTIAYGYSRTNGAANLTVYPGHFNLTWFPTSDLGLRANRYGRSTTVANWTIFATGNGGVFFLIDDGGDGLLDNGNFRSERNVIYEFPQGLLTTSTNPTSIVVVTSTTVRLTGFDLNGDTISTSDWSITDLNGGSAIFNNDSQSSGVQTVTMIYTAPANFVGQTTVVVTLQVDGLSTTHAISFIVDEPPTIALSTRHITLAEDFGTFDISTTVTDRLMSTSLPFSVSASPSGILTITTSANNIQLSAVSNANGTATLTVQAMDARGQFSIANVVVVVAPVNDSPVLSVSTTALTLLEDFSTVLIAATRSDLDGDNLTLTVSESTTGVVTVQTSTSGVSVSNIAHRNGRTTLTITLSDSELSTSTQVVVDVTAVNDPPTLTVSTTALTLNEDFATTRLITVNRSDIENDTLTLSVAASISGIVSVSTSSAGVQVVSFGNATGQTTLTITVSDSQASASTQVRVTVNAVNDTPTLSVSSNSISTVGGFSPITINTTASDIEDANISFTVIDANPGMVGVTTSTNAIVLNSIAGVSGQTTLTVRVVDSSGATVTEIITVSVTITPSVAPVLIVSTNLISVIEDFRTSVIFQTTATDADGDTITVSVSASRPIVTAVVSTPDNAQSTITNSITLTAIGDANGTATLTVVARDPGGQSHSTEIVVVVAPVEDTPTLTIPSATLTVAEEFSSTLTIATANDVDGDTLNVSVVQSNPGIVTVTTSAAGVFVSSILNANGQSILTITVNDGTQDTTAQVVVNVTPVNDPPILNIPSATLTRLEDFVGGITVATASDVDSTSLTFTVTESTTGVIRVTTSASDVRISSRGEANGVITLAIAVSDGEITTTAQVVVTVTPVNDPPALSVTTTALTLNEDFATVLIGTTRTDIDSNTLTLTVAESATGVVTVTITDAGVQVANIANTNGVTTLSIVVSDGDLTTTAQVAVTITPVNDPPALSVSTTALTLNEDFTTTEIITVNRSDIDSNTLTLTVVESATGVVSVTTTDTGVQVTNIADGNGRTTLTIRVSDGDGGLASTDVVVVVNAVEDTPTLSVSTTNITAPSGFSAITINTTANDADEGALSFAVQVSTTNVVRVTTSANAIVLNAIVGVSGRTTLTVRTTDNTGRTAMQTIAVNVFVGVSAAPILTVSTNLIRVAEDFSSPVVIRTTATDADGDALIVSISSSSRLVDAVLSTPVSGVSTIINTITLTALSGLSGITTLTVQAIDGGGIATTQQIVVVVNAVDSGIPFTLSTTAVSLSVPGSQLDRIVNAISISNPANKTLRAQIQVTASGDSLFSANPAPVVSFTTNALTTTATLTSAASTAQLYFTIRPDRTGTATLVVQLTDLDTSLMTQQTMVVRVNSVNVPPTIVPTISSITRLTVFSGRLYANDVTPSTIGISRFLTTARALGGHLLNINSVEEYSFVRSPASSGLVSRESYFGLVLPKRLFPGELSWITHDSTIAYGYSSTNGITNHTLYPGHYPLPWAPVNAGIGLLANRFGPTTTVSNWPIFSDGSGGVIYLVDNGGDIPPRARDVIYEFPQGLPIATNLTPINVATTATVQFTGYDLNGTDIINTTNWSGTDPNGGSVVFAPVASSTGVQSVSMTYSPPVNFGGQTTVVVTLTVDGLSTTVAKTFIVPPPPTIALSTNAITLDEDFGTFDIATTATEQGVSTSLPFWVQASASGIVTISTSANNIQLSAVSNVSGTVTLTVRTIDSASAANSTQVVVTVRSVNDTPTVTVSSDSISILGGFTPITIYTTATDIEQGVLPFTVQASPQGVVSISTRANTIMLSPTVGGSGRTTLTVSAIDGGGKTGIQTIAVNVMVTSSTAPVLMVSTNLINLQEDFGSVVIGTTANDAETGTLVVTVSSTTHLVNMVISTRSITLSSLPNIFGTTTLTVRARDDGGLFVSTELVVIVAPVNDTPTLSVSANMVSLGAAPFVVNVTAFDIEDTTLSFSVSSGQGFVNTVITTTSLTISRTGIMSFQMVLSLRTTDTAGVSVSTNITVVARPVLAVTTGIKTLNFAWDAVSSATYYRLRSNPDNSGFTDLSTRGVVVSPNSTNISQTSAQALVSLHRYIPNVTNPQYGVDTCDATSCGTSFRHDTVTLNKAQLDSMIGRLLASNAGGNDAFGSAVSLSGDGNTLAVGARGEQSSGSGINPTMRTDNAGGVGAVYLFRRNGGVWTEQAYIKASNSASFAGFGYSVSLSDDGNTLAVGASGDGGTSTGVNGSQAVTAGSNVGAAYLFRFSTNTNAWAQQAYIKASNAGPSDFFGRSVSLSNDGNTLAVSAHLEDGSTNNSTDTGAVYVFRYSSSTWAEQAYLKASNPGGLDEFGERVHLSGDGNTLAVGAVREAGSSTGVNGADNNSASDAGAVYVYRFSSSTWSQQAYIKASNARLNSEFGRSVSLSDDGNTLAVGATGEDTQFLSPLPNNFLGNSGAVYVFGFSTNTNTWAEQTFFKPSNINSGELFGWSVSLSSDGTALAASSQIKNGSAAEVGGLAGPDTGLSRTGAAYVFELGNGTWVQQAYIRASDPTAQGLFGSSVSLSSDGQTLAVGSNGSNLISTGFRTGVVYLY